LFTPSATYHTLYSVVSWLLLPYLMLVFINTAEVGATYSAFQTQQATTSSFVDYLDDVGPDADSDAEHDHCKDLSTGGVIAPCILPRMELTVPSCLLLWLSPLNTSDTLSDNPSTSIWMPPESLV
jgi:hypothetical protein